MENERRDQLRGDEKENEIYTKKFTKVPRGRIHDIPITKEHKRTEQEKWQNHGTSS
jgi:hypothetical protein